MEDNENECGGRHMSMWPSEESEYSADQEDHPLIRQAARTGNFIPKDEVSLSPGCCPVEPENTAEQEKASLSWRPVKPENSAQMEQLTALWIPYMREIYADDADFHETDGELWAGAAKRARVAAIQKNMYFELAENADGEAVGFLFYALDRGGIAGILPAGYGYIMEVYVAPAHRRHGYATEMYRRMRDTFAGIGVRAMYLTPDSRSGVPFWEKMGFRDSGLTDPDNHMPIYMRGTEKIR